GVAVRVEMVETDYHEQRVCADRYRPVGSVQPAFGVRVDLTACGAVECGVDVEGGTDRNRLAEIGCEPDGDGWLGQEVSDGRAEGFIEGAGQQATVRQPGCSLVGLGYQKTRVHMHVLSDGGTQVQSRGLPVAAPETLGVVFRELRARPGSF